MKKNQIAFVVGALAAVSAKAFAVSSLNRTSQEVASCSETSLKIVSETAHKYSRLRQTYAPGFSGCYAVVPSTSRINGQFSTVNVKIAEIKKAKDCSLAVEVAKDATAEQIEEAKGEKLAQLCQQAYSDPSVIQHLGLHADAAAKFQAKAQKMQALLDRHSPLGQAQGDSGRKLSVKMTKLKGKYRLSATEAAQFQAQFNDDLKSEKERLLKELDHPPTAQDEISILSQATQAILAQAETAVIEYLTKLESEENE